MSSRYLIFYISSLLYLAACKPASVEAPEEVTEVVSDPQLPDLLTTTSGNRIESAAEWENGRRQEVMELFQSQVYGKVPQDLVAVSFQENYTDEQALGGTAIARSVTVKFAGNNQENSMHLMLYLPKNGPGPYPVFLGLNFYGNHTINADPNIPISASWVPDNTEFCIAGNQADEVSRGVRSSRWPVERLLKRGYGLATIYCGDIDPDFDDGFKNGVHQLFREVNRNDEAWGTISAWAWGLSRGLDYLAQAPGVDAQKVMVLGHSRLGKAALWAGAQDERFAIVFSNDSGCGGAALSKRKSGERLLNINTSFPHWFARNFRQYNEQEENLPMDQHMLLALIAPRPVYVASAEQDDWADPTGEYMSLYHSLPVYRLYTPDIQLAKERPAVNEPVQNGPLGYHIRTGRHDITRYDWERYMDFADRYFSKLQ